MSQSNNIRGELLVSAARTAAEVVSADMLNTSWRGGHFVINVTAYTSGTYTPTLQGKDPISGNYYDLLVGAAIGATGMTVLKLYPGIGVVANGSASDILPMVWRLKLAGASTPSMTFSAAYHLEV